MRTLVICLLVVAGSAIIFSCGKKQEDTGERPEVGISIDSLVRRVAIPSARMSKVFNAYVVLPEEYMQDSSSGFYPVVYLLHGYSDSYAKWYETVPKIVELATRYNMIIVTPEGDHNSWYLDGYTDQTRQFFTYVSQEVPGYIDAHFRTYNDARYRGITGLSMGGHGALHVALQHPDWFGVAGSMSGVVDISRHPEEWELKQQLGAYREDSTRWQQHSVLQLVGNLQRAPHLVIDCGTEDFLLPENNELHQRLLERGIEHSYTVRPGGHDWLYWEEAIEYQLLFFAKRFAEG